MAERTKALNKSGNASPAALDQAVATATASAARAEAAHVTLTRGMWIGTGEDAEDQLAMQLDTVRAREGETVPESGNAQGQNEVALAIAAARPA